MKSLVIYKITSPSNRVYIGQTCRLHSRFKTYSFLSCKSQLLLYNSLKKYGWDNHIKEVLYTNLDQKEADKKEIELIQFYKKEKVSLNIADGGKGRNTFLKPIVQFDLQSNFIKVHTDVNKICIELQCVPANFYVVIKLKRYYSKGYLWCLQEDYDNGFIPKWNERKSKISKKIVQLTLEGVLLKTFDNAKEIEKAGFNREGINTVLSNNKYFAYDYLWMYEKDFLNGIIPKRRTKDKKVVQYTYQKIFIKEYDSISEMCLELNISKSAVSNHLKGKSKYCYGWIFKYKNE